VCLAKVLTKFKTFSETWAYSSLVVGIS
jgi:hypothetical protein